MVSVEVPDPPEIWIELSVAVRPVGVDTESVTVPVNSLIGATVNVVVPEDPALMLRLDGDAEIV